MYAERERELRVELRRRKSGESRFGKHAARTVGRLGRMIGERAGLTEVAALIPGYFGGFTFKTPHEPTKCYKLYVRVQSHPTNLADQWGRPGYIPYIY